MKLSAVCLALLPVVVQARKEHLCHNWIILFTSSSRAANFHIAFLFVPFRMVPRWNVRNVCSFLFPDQKKPGMIARWRIVGISHSFSFLFHESLIGKVFSWLNHNGHRQTYFTLTTLLLYCSLFQQKSKLAVIKITIVGSVVSCVAYHHHSAVYQIES